MRIESTMSDRGESRVEEEEVVDVQEEEKVEGADG